MKNIFFACPLLFMFLSACNVAQVNELSETETNGVSAVGTAFGSKVIYRQTISASTLEGNANVFELRIDSLTEAVARYKERPFLLTSNAAVLFYKNLTGEEKHSLTAVHIVLPYSTDGMDMHKYKVGLLDTLVSKMLLVEQVVACLENKRYEDILTLIGKPLEKTAKNEALKSLKSYEADFGDIKGFIPLGFQFYQREGEPEYARFYALLHTRKQNLQFSLDFYLDPEVQQISALRYNHKF